MHNKSINNIICAKQVYKKSAEQKKLTTTTTRAHTFRSQSGIFCIPAKPLPPPELSTMIPAPRVSPTSATVIVTGTRGRVRTPTTRGTPATPSGPVRCCWELLFWTLLSSKMNITAWTMMTFRLLLDLIYVTQVLKVKFQGHVKGLVKKTFVPGQFNQLSWRTSDIWFRAKNKVQEICLNTLTK